MRRVIEGGEWFSILIQRKMEGLNEMGFCGFGIIHPKKETLALVTG